MPISSIEVVADSPQFSRPPAPFLVSDETDDEDYVKRPQKTRMQVYFALSPTLGEVKVGVSSDPERRAKAQRLDLLGYVPGGRDLERSLHRRFADRRTGREWFTAEILPEVQAILGAPCGQQLPL